MKNLICSCLCLIMLSGCASVKFYSSKDNYKEETGIKYYEAKPYMLVTHKEKDKLDIQLIYLPDKSTSYITKFSPGLGSHEFTVGLSNGILTSYGQKSDPKIAELIQSMTGLLKEGVATATSAGVFAAQGAPNFSKLASDVNNIASDLEEGIKKNPLANAEKAFDKVTEIIKSLKNAKQELEKPVPDKEASTKMLKSCKEDLNALIKPDIPAKYDTESPTARYNFLLKTTINRIEVVINAMKDEPAPGVPFELYEIIIDAATGGTSLRKVQ